MIAKTLYGLEETLSQELYELEANDIKPMNRSVEFFGDMKMLYKANLWCRTATRILVPINSFRVKDENDLYRKVMKIIWTDYMNLKQTIAIDAVISNSNFDNSLYVAQKTKDAICDQFRNKTGRRPSVDTKNPDIRINIHISNNQCTLALDSSGEPLFKRGYRGNVSKAPLNEVLAAGLVYKSEWDRNSSFIDAMCGSGTIVIEAALMARNIAPGLTRKHFAFMNWPDYDSELFASITKKARNKIKQGLDFEIIGSDMNSKQIFESLKNAERAGVGNDTKFVKSKISMMVPPEAPGVLIINPPYGERMEVGDIARFYHTIGDILKKNYSGYDAFIFTGNLSAAKSIGLRTSRKIQMYNGAIECRLLKFEMYRGTRKTKD